MVVVRHAKEFAVIDRGRASRDRRPLPSRLDLHRRAPDLRAGFDVDGEGPPAVDHVHDTVVNGGRRQLPHVIHQARAPDGHKAPDIGRIDLVERAVALSVVAHALGRHVLRVLAVVDELVDRLGQAGPGPESQQRHERPHSSHEQPPCFPSRIVRLFRPQYRTVAG